MPTRTLSSKSTTIDADTALRFLDAVDLACERLAEYPEIGKARKFENPRLRGLRLRFLPDFPEHLVFYRLTDEYIELVRILHAKRDLDAALDE